MRRSWEPSNPDNPPPLRSPTALQISVRIQLRNHLIAIFQLVFALQHAWDALVDTTYIPLSYATTCTLPTYTSISANR